MSFVEIDFQGERLRLRAQKIKGRLWFHWAGKTWCYEPPKTQNRSRSGAVSQTGEIKAPMPGKVIHVKMNVGDSVESGDIIIVMEAMKMEYSLKADQSGRLKELKVREGSQVSLGQSLALIEPA